MASDMAGVFAVFTMLSSLALVAGIVYAILNLHKPGAMSLTLLLLVQFFWAAASVAEFLSQDFATGLFWYHAKATFSLFVGPLFLFLMIKLSGSGSWLTRSRVLLVLAVPLLAMLISWLWPEGLIYTDHNFRLVQINDLSVIRYDPGAISFINMVFAYTCLIGGMTMLLRSERSKVFMRSQRRLWGILAYMSILGTAEALYRIVPGLTGGFNLTPGLAGIANLPLIYAVLWEGFLDISPIAQNTLFANMRDGLLVFDSNMRLVECNEAARRILKLKDNPIGMNPQEIIPEWATRIRPELADTQPLSELQNEAGIFEIQTNILYDKRSQAVGRMIILRDISSRRRAESLLRLQVTALQASADAIAIHNPEGHFVWINPAFTKLTGYTFEEIRGQSPQILRSGLQPTEFYTELWQTIRSGKSWQSELFNKHKDGSIYPEEQSITPVMDENGSILYYISIKRDIRQRKELESLRQDMTNMFIHDLRTPLNQVMLALGILSNKSSKPEHDELIKTAVSGTKRMHEMINDILTIGRLESGQMTIDWKELDLYTLSERVLENQRLQANAQQVQLINFILPELPHIIASEHLMERVLQNLISNALRFTQAGGAITLQARTLLDQKMRVDVVDTGQGIDPKIEFKLFEKYATSGGGLGLGLSFCRLAINAHHGEITARNRPEGGAVFSFTIPIGPHEGLSGELR